MKRLIITICTLFFITCLWAYNREIKLSKVISKNKAKRSISIDPSAYQDGSTIYFYSNLPLENLQVTIRDEAGQVISEETIFVSPQQPSTFSIGNVEEGIYSLELNNGQDEYYGYFEINQ